MKTLRFLGMALIAVLVSVGFSGCGGSDDDDNGSGGSSASTIEGTWYLKSLKGYYYYVADGKVEPHNSSKNPDVEYDDNSKSVAYTLSLRGENISFFNGSNTTFLFEKMEGNEYMCKRPNTDIYDRIVIKDVSKDRLVFEWWDNYFKDASGTVRDTSKNASEKLHFHYGIHTLIR